MNHLCYLCFVFVMLSCLFIAALCGHLLGKCWPLCSFVCDVVFFVCVFVTFPCGVLRQVWYLIVSIPDNCLLTFFQDQVSLNAGQKYCKTLCNTFDLH